MNKNKQTWILGAAIAIAVIGVVFGVWKYRQQRQIDGVARQSQQKHDQAVLALHTVCLNADSVGIDTARFAATGSATIPQLAEKQQRLAFEVRYGKKPSRLSFAGLRETVDTTNAAVDLPIASTFGPYNQLVAHYGRLRKANASPDSLRLIRQTLNFYRYLNRFSMDKFAVVNIPSGELNVFDQGGKRLLPMQVIVGKKDKKTPCMATYVNDIVTYPYWNVPKSIATKEMLPKIQANLNYLEDQNLEVLDRREQTVDPETIDWESLSATDFPYRIRQASGCSNSLGLIKFDLANPFAIYLHDTNSRDLFTESTDRFRSHGCVRVQKPVELANFVLGATVFDKGYMNRCLIDQKPKTIKLPKPFPVFIVYNTADVDAAGTLRFYRDIYALDK